MVGGSATTEYFAAVGYQIIRTVDIEGPVFEVKDRKSSPLL